MDLGLAKEEGERRETKEHPHLSSLVLLLLVLQAWLHCLLLRKAFSAPEVESLLPLLSVSGP